MKSFFFNSLKIAVLTLNLFAALNAFANPKLYDREETKRILLSLAENPPIPDYKVSGDFPSEAHKAFLDFYFAEILPTEIEAQKLVYQIYAYSLLTDAGAYANEEELQEWQTKVNEITSALNELDVSKEWTETLKKAVKLSEGLSGSLVEELRQELKERELTAFPPEMKEKLDEISVLRNEYDLALSSVPANSSLAGYLATTQQTVREFRSGSISFEEASQRIAEAYANAGYRYVGYEAVSKHPEHLNRMAVLRSELAKSKGFATWSEYRLTHDTGYAEEYRGAKNQKSFLKEIISNLSPKIQELLEKRRKDLNLEVSQLKRQFLSLLLPQSLSQIMAHYPADSITETWTDVMLRSGFKASDLNQILVDAHPRENKNATGAYLAPILAPYLEEKIIDARTVEYITPSSNSPLWKPGLVYIMQSYLTGGVSEFETMFHEGGHALEKVLKFKNEYHAEAYGYVEVPSMTMEHFLKDPEVLYQIAKEVNGTKPSRAEIEILLHNSQLAEAYGFLSSAAMSLFDIELWDYDYSAPNAMTFLERVKLLNEEIDKSTSTFDSLPSDVPDYYHLLSTGHFYSGAVRNIGYVFAELASLQMANFISEQLEERTGSRSWWNQPDLAELFGKRFFAQGWKKPFPQNIEEITGKPYDPKTLIDELLKPLFECDEHLKSIYNRK